MARNDNTPSVATYADHEVITPANPLRKAVVHKADPYDDPVGRAEVALAQLSNEFPAWMEAECDKLEAARQEVKRLGFTTKTHGDLFRASHDIRGEAATFGFGLAGPVADSLCRLLEHSPIIARIPVALAEQHVDAVRAIVREYHRVGVAGMAAVLASRLREVTDEFLRTENAERPDYLESIFAPSTAP